MKPFILILQLLCQVTLTASAQPCNPVIPNGDWDNLVKFKPTANLAQSTASRGHEVQSIFDASSLGDKVNLDYYGITITAMPKENGKTMSPAALLNRIRLRFGSYLDHSLAKFEPLEGVDAPTWQAGAPGTLLLFLPLLPTIPGPGIQRVTPVMYVPIDGQSWRFLTVASHPVSGTREFGIRQKSDDNWEIYTRGADRITFSGELPLLEGIFGGGEQLWESFQDKVSADIRSMGGTVSDNPISRGRYCWADMLHRVQP